MIFGFSLVAALVLLPLSPHADDPSEARKVVDRAIANIGGADHLRELTGGVWKTKSIVQGNPSQADFYGELPGKFRLDSTRSVEGKKVRFSRIINGDKGWIVQDGNVSPMNPQEITAVQTSFFHKQTATTLLPLIDKSVQLVVLRRNLPLEGRRVTQLKAMKKGFPDLLLWFDDQSGLLVKSQMTDKDPNTMSDRRVEIHWLDYKVFDGVKMATRTKTYHNDKLFIDSTLIHFKITKTLPESTFMPNKK